jgi:hypothetical protein
VPDYSETRKGLRWGLLSCFRVGTAPDFKAMVMESIKRSVAEGRQPRRGEALLIGQAASGGLIRLKIPRRYRLFDTLMVRAFVKRKEVDRLGIVVGDDSPERNSKRFGVALIDRADVEIRAGSLDPRIAKLARAAQQGWSGIRPPMRSVIGRPWPIAYLTLVLLVELALGLRNASRILAGDFAWLPVIPEPDASAAYAVYLVVVVVTLVALWRQTKLGYVLALCLAGLQVVRPIAVVISEAQTVESSQLVVWLAWSLLLPACLVLGLGLLYQERRLRT